MESRIFVFAYLCISRCAQGYDFPRQRQAVRKYAAANRMRVAQYFEEQVVPGKSGWDERPAWLAMLDKITGGGIRTILIEKLDRLAREPLVQEHIIADLHERRVALISVAEPDLFVNDPNRIVLRQIMGAIHQYRRAMLGFKLKAAKDPRPKDVGRSAGGKPYGDRPGETAIRDRIKAMRSSGSTLQAICDKLDSEGIKTRRGRRWAPITVARIAAR